MNDGREKKTFKTLDGFLVARKFWEIDGFLVARKFWERTLSKLPKSVQNPSKALKTPGTGPYSGRDVRVGFSGRALPSNRADFLKTLHISLYFIKRANAF